MQTHFPALNAFAKRNRFHMCKHKGSLVQGQLVMKPSFQHIFKGKAAKILFFLVKDSREGDVGKTLLALCRNEKITRQGPIGLK